MSGWKNRQFTFPVAVYAEEKVDFPFMSESRISKASLRDPYEFLN